MSAYPSLSVVLVAALLPASALSQSAPAAPARAPSHSHAPAPSSHGHGVVTLDQFVTTAAPFARNQVDLAQATTVLSGGPLRLKQQATLGETLAAETGMAATSFGPGASRPIIRGLGGDRIRVLENSVGTLDASVTSPDHAVTIEPLLVERIEVVRGPASLLYGSSAVGGVVNVITHRIETDLPTEKFRGGVEMRGGTAANEFARGGVLDFALLRQPSRALVFHVDGFRRTTSDLRIPGFAESARVRAEDLAELDAGEAPPDFAFGRLPNSALRTDSGAAGVSFISAPLHVGASYSGINSTYGVPGHAHEEEESAGGEGGAAGVQIQLRQRRTDVQGEWHGDGAFVTGARFKFGQARYRHTEMEPDGAVGTLFTNRGHEGRFELLHGGANPWTGALGLQSSFSDFEAEGEEAFLPPSTTRQHAIFAFEELSRGAITWQVGARAERTTITPAAARRRAFTEMSASLGAVHKLGDAYTLAASVARTSRAPNAQELFARGPHAGTQAFEIGDRTLQAEESIGWEANLRRRTGQVTGALTVYLNDFDRYIFESPTGQVAVRAAGEDWALVDAEDPRAEAEAGLPVFAYEQRDARFYGAEIETTWHLHEKGAWQTDLRIAGDITRAAEGGRHLPRIPAARVTGGLHAVHGETALGVDFQYVFDQRRVAQNETATRGYRLLSAYVSHTLEIGRTDFELFVRAANLLNEEVRPHPSFVKDLAPLAGRGATAGFRISF